MQKVTLRFPIAADKTTASAEIRRNKDITGGKPYQIDVDMPNWTNAVTGTLSVKNTDGSEIYSKSSLAKNVVTTINDAVFPFAENLTVTLTLTGVPGGTGGTAAVYFYFENA
jgi:hypothetical protein